MTAATELTAPAAENAAEEPYYPYCDGKPMAESDVHVEAMLHCLAVLQKHFENSPDVYVAGNNFLYYVQGKPRIVVSPDCYVVFGAGAQQRKSYKAWEAGGLLPSVTIEITSATTRREDVGRKFRLYQDVFHTQEYFLYDPTGDYIGTRIWGYRLTPDAATGSSVYRRILPDAQGRLHSEQLGLTLVIENDRLRFFDPARGVLYQTYGEEFDRAESEARRADSEAQRADSQAQRADSEAQARAAVEAELAQMRAALQALQKQTQELAARPDTSNTPQAEQK